MKQRILVFYDYFTPAYKAGGPIQSLTNLVRQLHEHFDFYIFTTNQDHDGTVLTVDPDEFVDFEQKAQVFYASPHQRKYTTVRQVINDVAPELVYLNGMFSVLCVVFPLMALRKRPDVRVVIAPRGMLQAGARKIKALKKNIYLILLKAVLLKKGNYWHATDDAEMEDIKAFAGLQRQIIKAENIPTLLNLSIWPAQKKGLLKMVTISLVARKKNHLQLLNILKGSDPLFRLHYDIYGPIADKSYWKECLEEMALLPSNVTVNYKGAVQRNEIESALSAYHFFVLPSFGENFGHAIFEALSAGLPVIISDQTPWRNLAKKKAGWDVSLENPGALRKALDEAVAMEQDEYEAWRKGARKLALDYLDESDFEAAYKALFGK